MNLFEDKNYTFLLLTDSDKVLPMLWEKLKMYRTRITTVGIPFLSQLNYEYEDSVLVKKFDGIAPTAPREVSRY